MKLKIEPTLVIDLIPYREKKRDQFNNQKVTAVIFKFLFIKVTFEKK